MYVSVTQWRTAKSSTYMVLVHFIMIFIKFNIAKVRLQRTQILQHDSHFFPYAMYEIYM